MRPSRLQLTVGEGRQLPFRTYDHVLEFHQATGASISKWPADEDEKVLRHRLIQEELDELYAALADGDLVEVADALADLDYVVNGAAIAFGINLPVVTKEVHRSNMTKLGEDGKPVLREDGKVLKGPNYEPPNIEWALNNGGIL